MAMHVKSDITSMMIRRDGRTLDLAVDTTDADAFQIAHSLKHLPEHLQPALQSHPEKLAAFLPTFFVKTSHPQGFDFCYVYIIDQAERSTALTVLTHKKPETADDFCALALAVKNQSLYDGKNVLVANELGGPADEHQRKMFVYSLLQDAALAGNTQAATAVAELLQDAEENNYVSISRFQFLYSYKNNLHYIYLPVAPSTPEQFFELAHDPMLASKLMVYVNQSVQAAQGSYLNGFIYSLLRDADKAGHLEAKRQLVDATIAGNAAAKEFVTFARYNPDLPILLPRQFVTAKDFYKLSISLITHGKYIVGHGPLEGPFYVVPDGDLAERLGYQLRMHADKLQRDEDELRKAKLPLVKSIAVEVAEEIVEPEVDPNQNWISHWVATEAAFFKKELNTAAHEFLKTDPNHFTPAMGIKVR